MTLSNLTTAQLRDLLNSTKRDLKDSAKLLNRNIASKEIVAIINKDIKCNRDKIQTIQEILRSRYENN